MTIGHIDVPKDLNGIRTTFAFGMSGKQLIMLSAGAVITLAFTSFLRSSFRLTIFTSFLISSIPTLVPIAFCAFYQKNGMSFSKIASIILRHKVRYKQIRLYKNKNFYYQAAQFNVLQSSSNNNNKRERLNAENATKKSIRNKKY